jgi:pyruvate dehydrogenase phosphatase
VASGIAVVGAYLIYNNSQYINQPEQDAIYQYEVKRATLSDPDQIRKEARNPVVSRDSISSRRATLSIPKSEEITDILRENEASYYIGRKNGVQRFDTCQVASNTPIEDAHSEKILEAPITSPAGADWMFWGIYDGHRYVTCEHKKMRTKPLQWLANLCQIKAEPHWLCI